MMTWKTYYKFGRWYLIIQNITLLDGRFLSTTQEYGPYLTRSDALRMAEVAS